MSALFQKADFAADAWLSIRPWARIAKAKQLFENLDDLDVELTEEDLQNVAGGGCLDEIIEKGLLR